MAHLGPVGTRQTHKGIRHWYARTANPQVSVLAGRKTKADRYKTRQDSKPCQPKKDTEAAFTAGFVRERGWRVVPFSVKSDERCFKSF